MLRMVGASRREKDIQIRRHRPSRPIASDSTADRFQYFAITLERATKILDALNVQLRTQVAIEPLPPSPVARAS
jgi:hypothetical protein